MSGKLFCRGEISIRQCEDDFIDTEFIANFATFGNFLWGKFGLLFREKRLSVGHLVQTKFVEEEKSVETKKGNENRFI
jgi:hypothetical protein